MSRNTVTLQLLNVSFYTLILLALPYLLNLNSNLSITRDMTEAVLNPDYAKPENEIYDFIIGGGTAGALLANRLSANPTTRVLLLERGGDPDTLLDVPIFTPVLVANQTDYGYLTVPQNNSFYASGNVLHQIRGKGLGGSGNLNYMQYQRGNAKCYDEWAQLTGDKTWNFRNVLKYFKRFEDYDGFYPDERYHSTGGDVRVSKQTFHPSSRHLYAACKEKGINMQDINTGEQPAPVFAPADVNTKRGRRWGPFQSFLIPVLHRTNLRIYRYSQVVKVNFDYNLKATGVTYVRHGVTRVVNANNEVILSAGTIDTPKILLLSGVGPAAHLKSLNIQVLKKLPVGRNLQDHVCTVLSSFHLDKKVAFVPPRDLSPLRFFEYAGAGTGPLSAVNTLFSTGFVSSPSNPTPAIPDIQIFIAGTYLFNNPFNTPISGGGGVTRGSATEPTESRPEPPDANSMVVLLGRPASTSGEVKLASTNPLDNPIIDPKFFSNPADMPRLIDGVKFIVDLYQNSTAFKKLGAKLVLTIPNMCRDIEYQSDAFWECYIRFFTGVIHHPVGTCRMGKADDPKTVVDSRLRVVGTSGLRIVDGSIMPKVVNAPTNTPIYMIAELAADFILGNVA